MRNDADYSFLAMSRPWTGKDFTVAGWLDERLSIDASTSFVKLNTK
jgi:hypothetical protein